MDTFYDQAKTLIDSPDVNRLFAFTPEFGRSFLLKSFCIIMLAGMESVAGVALGALVLALLESAPGASAPQPDPEASVIEARP